MKKLLVLLVTLLSAFTLFAGDIQQAGTEDLFAGIDGQAVTLEQMQNTDGGFLDFILDALSIAKSGTDFVKNPNLENGAALAADIACAFVPGLTGGGTAVKTTAELIEQTGKKTVGETITGYTKHGLNQAISRNDGKGVDPKAIIDAVKNPQKVIPQVEKGTTKYVGKDATVVLNEGGKIVTTYGKPRTK